MTQSLFELEHNLCKEIREAARYESNQERPAMAERRSLARVATAIGIVAALIPVYLAF